MILLDLDIANDRVVIGPNYHAREIPVDDARKIVKKYHYSKKVVANSSIHIGIFRDNSLVGCLQFGPPMNGEKTTKKISSDAGIELNRMVMSDDEPRNAESQAISLSVKYLKRYYKDISFILSFSDSKEGNVGYIYQATNWMYIGYLYSDSFFKLDGQYMHAVQVWHKFKESHPDRDTKTTNEILFDNFRDISRVGAKQFVYVMPLRKSVRIAFPCLPYPKLPHPKIISETFLKRSGVICTPPEIFMYDDMNINPIW